MNAWFQSVLEVEVDPVSSRRGMVTRAKHSTAWRLARYLNHNDGCHVHLLVLAFSKQKELAPTAKNSDHTSCFLVTDDMHFFCICMRFENAILRDPKVLEYLTSPSISPVYSRLPKLPTPV